MIVRHRAVLATRDLKVFLANLENQHLGLKECVESRETREIEDPQDVTFTTVTPPVMNLSSPLFWLQVRGPGASRAPRARRDSEEERVTLVARDLG